MSLAYGINSSNEIVGYGDYSDTIAHGFFRDAAGTLTFPIDPPGSTGTFLFGISDQGLIVGRYADSTGVEHGFLLRLPSAFVVFDYPGATFTSLNGINKLGLLCGRYDDGSGIFHGIVARVRRVPANEP